MTDLVTRAKDYLAQTEGITTDTTWEKVSTNENTAIIISCPVDGKYYSGEFDASDIDETAMSLTPTARKLILELALEVMLLRQWVDLEPKDGFDDEIEIYKRLAKR